MVVEDLPQVGQWWTVSVEPIESNDERCVDDEYFAAVVKVVPQ